MKDLIDDKHKDISGSGTIEAVCHLKDEIQIQVRVPDDHIVTLHFYGSAPTIDYIKPGQTVSFGGINPEGDPFNITLNPRNPYVRIYRD